MLNLQDKAPPANIKISLANLVEDYSSLNNEFNFQVDLLRSNLITQIVNSALHSEKDIIEHINNLNLTDLISNSYILICGKIPVNLAKASVNQIITESKTTFNKYGYISYLQELSNNKFCILVGSDELISESDLISPLIELNESLLKNLKVTTLFVVGSPFSVLTHIQISYYRVLSTLDSAKYKKNENIIFVSQNEQSKTMYCIPIEIESKIITLVQLGNYPNVEKLIDNIVMDSKFTVNTATTLCYEFQSLLIKLIYANEKKPQDKDSYLLRVSEIFAQNSFEKIVVQTKLLIKTMCENNSVDKQDKHDSFGQKIHQIVQENYTNPEFCRAYIAQSFNVSEKHLTRVFKEIYGKTVSFYIEELRMEKSLEYILDDNVSITDIYKKVGFFNQNTFYKAFKRKYLISPSEYRQNIKGF